MKRKIFNYTCRIRSFLFYFYSFDIETIHVPNKSFYINNKHFFFNKKNKIIIELFIII